MRDAATLASTASPSAPPIMNAVLTIPDTRPDSCGSTSLIAAISTGLNAIPAPIPSSTMPGSTSITYRPSSGARAKSSSPTAATDSPTASGRLIPNRMTIFADSPSESAPITRFPGRNASPTCSGLYPSTSCR